MRPITAVGRATLPGDRDFYRFADLPETCQTLRKGEKCIDDLRIQVERKLRRAFIERAQERPLHLATHAQLRNSGSKLKSFFKSTYQSGKCFHARPEFIFCFH